MFRVTEEDYGVNEAVRGQKRRSVSLRKTMVKIKRYVVKKGVPCH